MTISGISGSSNAWAGLAAARAGRMQERMFEKADADADGSGAVDASELQSLLDTAAEKTGTAASSTGAELLSKLDTDGNGSLGQDELAAGLQSILPPPSTMAFAQSRGTQGDDLFGKVDTDGDGALSQTEFEALAEKMSARGGRTEESSASERFSALDEDGDGSLSQAEFEAGRPSGPPPGAGMPPPPRAAASEDSETDPLDTNGDGVVSAAERAAGATATDAVQALLQAIDSDQDGQISETEGDAFLTKLAEAVQSASETQATAAAGSTSNETQSDADILAKSLASLLLRQYAQIAGIAESNTAVSTLSASA